jgi:hypothetical protein
VAEDGRWDLHEVPTHFTTEDRWIPGGYTTFEGGAGIVAAGAGYLLYRILPSLGTFSIREVGVPVAFLVVAVLWLIFWLSFVQRWDQERMITKLWRRVFFAVRPKKTVSRPRATLADRRLVAEATADEDEEEE